MANATLAELQHLHPELEVKAEGGVQLIYLPCLKIRIGSETQVYAALLCPQSHTGYDTRLFLDRPVPGRGANWRSYPLLGRTWWACSIRGIASDQPLISMLLAFLDHFK
jgi:hypothetical protein